MINKTLSDHFNQTTTQQYTITKEGFLDLITFNATTLAREYTQETRENESKEENYLTNKIKTIQAQLDSKATYGPITYRQWKYTNSLQNKLEKTKKQFKDLKKQKFQTTYLENLRSELLNPKKNL